MSELRKVLLLTSDEVLIMKLMFDTQFDMANDTVTEQIHHVYMNQRQLDRDNERVVGEIVTNLLVLQRYVNADLSGNSYYINKQDLSVILENLDLFRCMKGEMLDGEEDESTMLDMEMEVIVIRKIMLKLRKLQD